jgi:hypothetical protein
MAASDKSRRIAAVKKRIQPVSESSPYVRALFYGRNGRGKTRAAAMGGGKTLVFDINEEGTRSIQNYKDVYRYPCSDWPSIAYGYWYLKEGDHDYTTVVLDTWTQAQKLGMKQVLQEAEDRDPMRPPSTPDQRTWGKLAELMNGLTLDFRNLPMHVVFVCQERIDKNADDEEGESTPRTVPDLAPSIRGTVMSAVGIIGRVYKREVRVGEKGKTKTKWEPRMLVGDHEDFESKDRTGVLPRVVRNPTLGTIIEAWAQSPPQEEDNG